MRRALGFLTPIPVGGPGGAPDARTFDWFPVAGALVGAGVGAVWWAAAEIWPPVVAAAIAVAADLALTGLLHVDGLIDSADGLLPPLAPERRLAIMAAPDVGAFGVAVAVATLLLRFAAFVSLSPSILLVAGLWCGSRTAMATIARTQPYARANANDGLARPFLGGAALPVAIGGTALALLLTVVAGEPAAVAALGVGVVAVTLFARRRIGGFTGDVLGAAGVVGETFGLLVAAAR